MEPTVTAVSCSSEHAFSKANQPRINLIKGIGVEGDAHAGKTGKHRYLVEQDANRPNIRQVHIMHAELFDELTAGGFSVGPGQLGENITTRGIDLLVQPTGIKLRIGPQAAIELTSLRNPCHQIDDFQKGMLKFVVDRDEDGTIIRKAGVMGVVLAGGEVRPGDAILIELPPEPHHQLEYVW